MAPLNADDIDDVLESLEGFWREAESALATLDLDDSIAIVEFMGDHHIATDTYRAAQQLSLDMSREQKLRFSAVNDLKAKHEPAIMEIKKNG